MPSGWGKGLAVKKGAHWGGLPERCSHTLGSGGCDIPTGLDKKGTQSPRGRKEVGIESLVASQVESKAQYLYQALLSGVQLPGNLPPREPQCNTSCICLV